MNSPRIYRSISWHAVPLRYQPRQETNIIEQHPKPGFHRMYRRKDDPTSTPKVTDIYGTPSFGSRVIRRSGLDEARRAMEYAEQVEAQNHVDYLNNKQVVDVRAMQAPIDFNNEEVRAKIAEIETSDMDDEQKKIILDKIKEFEARLDALGLDPDRQAEAREKFYSSLLRMDNVAINNIARDENGKPIVDKAKLLIGAVGHAGGGGVAAPAVPIPAVPVGEKYGDGPHVILFFKDNLKGGTPFKGASSDDISNTYNALWRQFTLKVHPKMKNTLTEEQLDKAILLDMVASGMLKITWAKSPAPVVIQAQKILEREGANYEIMKEWIFEHIRRKPSIIKAQASGGDLANISI